MLIFSKIDYKYDRYRIFGFDMNDLRIKYNNY